MAMPVGAIQLCPQLLSPLSPVSLEIMQNSIPPLAIGVITGLRDGPLAGLQSVRDAGIMTVHLQYPARFDNAEGIEAIRDAVRQTGVAITTVFCGFEGESYADIATVINTVGLVPEAPREARVEKIEQISRFASELVVERIGAHIGFIPGDADDPRYDALALTVRGICDSLSAREQVFALETGQETAESLNGFIEAVGRPNLKVNFDPANMIMYGTESPIPATELLFAHIDGVHCKDGDWPREKGELGEETPLGAGAVDVRAWLHKLVELGYRGPLTIEREISGAEQMRDVMAAKALIESIVNDAGHSTND